MHSHPTTPATVSNPRWVLRLCTLTLLLGILLSVGCNTVDFTQRRLFSDKIMELDMGESMGHWRSKCLYSREGAVGGVGSTAGGGCGCY